MTFEKREVLHEIVSYGKSENSVVVEFDNQSKVFTDVKSYKAIGTNSKVLEKQELNVYGSVESRAYEIVRVNNENK